MSLNYVGGFDVDAERPNGQSAPLPSAPITVPYFKAGLCPVNVHWKLGAEHKSDGEFDAAGTGPAASDDAHPRLRANSADVGEGIAGTTTSSGRQLAGDTTRLGGRCHHYDAHDPAFTAAYDWK